MILHYCAIDETIKCIKTIRDNIDTKEYLLVVVDNASPNNTGLELVKLYGNDTDCHVILNQKNLGFAKGNNIGFLYAKEQGAQFICMINSDAFILNKDWTRQIFSDFSKYKFYVCGPDIITKDGNYVANPVGEEVPDVTNTKRRIRSMKIQRFLLRVYLDPLVNLISETRYSRQISGQYDRNMYYQNIMLHGCCLIFSPLYIEKYNGINSGTFLYCEEDLLYLEMQRRGHLMLYSPNIHVFHKGQASSEHTKAGRKGRLFTLNNHIKSRYVILETLRSLDRGEDTLLTRRDS